MIRIAISQAAFDAIASTLPLGSVGYEDGPSVNGERLIRLAPNVVDRLRAMGGRARATAMLSCGWLPLAAGSRLRAVIHLS